MEQVIKDPTKDAVILAVASALAGSPQAAHAVCELSRVMPVYFANQLSLDDVVNGYLAYVQGGPKPDWLKHALG